MAHYHNIAEQVLSIAADNEDSTAIITPRRDVTYGRLRRLTISAAQRMRQHGIDRSACVGLDLDSPVATSAITMACILLGCPWIHAPSLDRYKGRINITHLLFGPGKEHSESATSLKVEPYWSEPLEPEFDLARLGFEGPTGPDAIFKISQSSGTTGLPKLMAVTHRNLENVMLLDFNLARGQSVVGAYLTASPLVRQSQIIRMFHQKGKFAGGIDLAFFLRAGVNRVGGSPAQFAQLLNSPVPTGAKKIALGQVFGGLGSEKIFQEMFRLFERVEVRYGSTETSIVAEREVSFDDPRPNNVGRVMPDARIEIVGPNDQILPAGEEGLVRVQSNTQVDGYLADPEGTKAAFRGGWFYPGDLGFMSQSGELHIISRINDQLNLGGVKVNAARLDTVIQMTKNVRDGCCFADRGAHDVDELAVLLCAEPGAVLAQIVEELVGKMTRADIHVRIARVYVADSVPRNASGKVTRHEVVKAVKNIVPVLVKVTPSNKRRESSIDGSDPAQ